MKLPRAAATAAATAVMASAALLTGSPAMAAGPATGSGTSPAGEENGTAGGGSVVGNTWLTPGGNPPAGFTCALDEGITSELAGLQKSIRAASGYWPEFTYFPGRLSLTNNTGEELLVYPYVRFEQYAGEDDSFLRLMNVQYQIDGKQWHDLPLAEEDLAGYFGHVRIAAGATYTIEIRVMVSEDSPDGWARGQVKAEYWTTENQECRGGETTPYTVEVLAKEPEPDPEPAPGPGPGDETPRGDGAPAGETPAGKQPAGDRGELAETGSGAGLPLFALAGAAVAALGAGAMSAVRRSRGSGPAR